MIYLTKTIKVYLFIIETMKLETCDTQKFLVIYKSSLLKVLFLIQYMLLFHVSITFLLKISEGQNQVSQIHD